MTDPTAHGPAIAAAAVIALTGSITAAGAATVNPGGPVILVHHHKRHCTKRHPCVQPGGPNIPAVIPHSIAGDSIVGD